MQVAAALPSLYSARDRERQNCSHYKEKERKYQILEAKSLPLDVLKLSRYKTGCWAFEYAVQACEYRTAPDNPEHIESTQRINRCQSTFIYALPFIFRDFVYRYGLSVKAVGTELTSRSKRIPGTRYGLQVLQGLLPALVAWSRLV
jgi:hypothetical protein